MLTVESEVASNISVSSSFNIPNLMPDELFQGFYGRFLKVNGIKNISEGNLLLNKAIENINIDLMRKHAIFKIALLVGIDANEFIKRHTLITLQRSPLTLHVKKNDDSNVVNKLVSRLPKSGIHLCKDCVKEDINYLGFSFWRKSHQSLGTDWCLKHETHLLALPNLDSVYKQPSSFLMSNQLHELNTDRHDRENKFVKKFNELYQDYSDGSLIINVRAATKYLKENAQERNLRTCKNGLRKNISDLLIESLPENWRMNHFPGLVKSYQGEYLDSFDCVTSAHGNGLKISSVLLAAAVLGQDDDQLLTKLTNETESVNSPAQVNDEELVNGYIKYNGQLTKIESQLGITSSLLARRLNTLGCPSLKNLNISTIIALKAFHNGASLDEISKIKGINLNEFMDALRVGSINLGKALNYTV